MFLRGNINCVYPLFKFWRNFYRSACLKVCPYFEIGFVMSGLLRMPVRGSPELIYDQSCNAILILKCPILRQPLTHVSPHMMHHKLITRLILYVPHYQTPCIIILWAKLCETSRNIQNLKGNLWLDNTLIRFTESQEQNVTLGDPDTFANWWIFIDPQWWLTWCTVLGHSLELLIFTAAYWVTKGTRTSKDNQWAGKAHMCQEIALFRKYWI